MKHSFKEILENQEKFKNEIIFYLKKEYNKSFGTLNSMTTEDEELSAIIKRTREKFKHVDERSINKLFLLSENKSDDFYAFWNTATTEVNIFEYDKKKKNINPIRPRV